MPEYQIEMLWACHKCKRRGNKGLEKKCTKCGNIKTELDEEYMPGDTSEAAALHGEKEKRARAGEDWVCRYCDSLENRLDGVCNACGASQREGKEQRALASTAPVSIAEPYRPRKKPIPWGVLFTFSALLFSLFTLWLLLRTRVVEAHVDAVAWEHRVLIDRYSIQDREGWDPEPGAFEVHDRGGRIHHYDHVRVGSHDEEYPETYTCGQTCRTIPGSCSTSPRVCTPNRNGTASCSGGDRTCSPSTQSCSPRMCTRTAHRRVDDYADIPQNREWYSWRAWDWAYNRTVKHAGSTLKTTWPEGDELIAFLSDGEKERNRREASYHVTFRNHDDTFELSPSTLEEFERFSPGLKFRLKVGIARGVEVLSP